MLTAVMAALALATPMQAKEERLPWQSGSQQSPLAPALFHHGGPEACLFRMKAGRIELLDCALIDRPTRTIRSFRR